MGWTSGLGLKPSSDKLSLDRMFVWVGTWGNFVFLQARRVCSFEMPVGRVRWKSDGDIIGDLATPWQSSSDNYKIYTPTPPPPNAKFTKPLELGNFVVIFEVGPPALCGGHSSLPIQATERNPFCEGKRGLGGSEDTLWEEG